MKTKTIAVLLSIVVIPLALLAWMGLRMMRDDRQLHDHQVQTLIASQLKAVEASIQDYFKSLEIELQTSALGISHDRESIRTFLRTSPPVRRAMIFDARNRRIFPPQPSPLTDKERRFLERAGSGFSTMETPPPPQGKMGANPRLRANDNPAPQESDVQDLQGWQVWFSGSEMNHLFWWRDESRHLIGLELEPVRLLSNIIALLPDTGGPEDRLGSARIRLIDSQGSIAYQWGAFEPGEDESPLSFLPLGHPMGSWKLEYFGSGLQAGGGLRAFNVAGGLTVVGAVLLGLAFYLYREHGREMKLAEQRVNFVNQVSHELRTPLTNIRLYAELLDENLPEETDVSGEDSRYRRYLQVITSESRRLSRLIANVLNFARDRNDRLLLRMEPGNVDQIIKTTLAPFLPSLDAKGVRIQMQLGAGDMVEVDPDALEQILNNIFSNTEKYGASGGRMDIQSRRQGDRTFISVRDYGPGIPKREAQRIFTPFYRISSRSTDGVTGTGIGLGIARELARLHGGDITLMAMDPGACFQIELRTEKGET